MFLFSQNDLDVLRYSRITHNGDARFMALGGSMGALGANLSAINYNPAGLAIYRNGEFNVTGGFRFAGVNAEHYGTNTTDGKTNLFMGTLGFASAWEETSPYKDETSKKKFKDWSRRHILGFSYNKLNSFNQNIIISGNTYKKTIIDDFLGSAQNYTPGQLNYFYEGLAYSTYLIDTLPNYYSQYGTFIDTDKAFSQSKTINTTGSLNEYSLAYGCAIDNKTYFGIAGGIVRGKWNYTSEYLESDLKDSITYFESLDLLETIQTRALGVNLKVGIISRVSESFRIGAYIHTPTVIGLTDNYSTSLTSKFESFPGGLGAQIIPDSSNGTFTYRINTPKKMGASVAYLFEKFLAINFDAEYVNYQEGSLSAKKYSFESVNNGIRKKYKSTFNFRLGSEFNFQPLTLRFGFASYGSPFGTVLNGKNIVNSYSCGIGKKRTENKYFDFALIYNQCNEDYYIYSPKYIDASKLKFKTTQFVVTYRYKF